MILFSFIKGNELLEVLKRIQWGYFVLSILVAPAVVCASCLKWHLILVHGEKSVCFGRLLQIYCIGYFFSNILPSTIGGDVARAYYGGNEVDDQLYSAISVFIERFSGIVCLFLLVLLMPMLQPELYLEPPIIISAIGGFFGLAVILVLVSVPAVTAMMIQAGNSLSAMVVGWLAGLGSAKATGVATRLERMLQFLATKLEKVRVRLKQAWTTMSRNNVFLLKMAMLTLLFYMLAILNVFLSFKAFGVHVEVLTVSILVPAALFFAHFPVTILGNLGYFESVFVIFFMIAGVPPAESLVMGLLLRFKMFMVGGAGMIFYFTFNGRESKKTGDCLNY